MPRFSIRSKAALASCHPDLVLVLRTCISFFDFAVLEGHRSEERQNRLYAEGRTQVRHPHSRHNGVPSMAADIAPWPIDWADRERFTLLAGYILGTAALLYEQGRIEHRVRWGGDWDRDTEVDDNRFDDLPHFELYTP